MLVIVLPVVGIIIYFSFGINYRTHRLYSKKLIQDDDMRKTLAAQIVSSSETNLEEHYDVIKEGRGLVYLLLNDTLSPLTFGNKVQLLFNGEEKYPVMIKALENAKQHIHFEYYIYENDDIGNRIKEVLIMKAREGVKVRFIYDDFGSGSIRHKFARELREGGVEVFPFHKIRLLFLANRLNYRNHRKIVVIDGRSAFVGGINVSDRYINSAENTSKLYWRDTHLFVEGQGCHYLQYLFLCDWRFASGQSLESLHGHFFAGRSVEGADAGVQIAGSGPDSPASTIMLSLIKAISIARRQILITTPYFIPGESILDALKVAALSGIKVHLLVPGISDSRIVNAAAWSYYTDLLKAGVKIWFYKKGFVHSKTMVVDDTISVVGTANMDYRSFDLNFEVNAIVYDRATALRLKESFFDDLKNAEALDLTRWLKRPLLKQLSERVARLVSPLL